MPETCEEEICLVWSTAKPCIINRSTMPKKCSQLALGIGSCFSFPLHLDIVPSYHSLNLLGCHGWTNPSVLRRAVTILQESKPTCLYKEDESLQLTIYNASSVPSLLHPSFSVWKWKWRYIWGPPSMQRTSGLTHKTKLSVKETTRVIGGDKEEEKRSI